MAHLIIPGLPGSGAGHCGSGKAACGNESFSGT